MRIDPSDLATFLAIARHRSFRAAATELGVTPSALSHALRNIEERLGLRLVNRTTRSVALTEAGERLFARITPAFRDIDDALEDLNNFRGKPAGTLRFTAARQSAQLVLLPIVTRFLKSFPDVSVEIVVNDALIDMVAAGFDAGVRFGETIAADMIAVPVGVQDEPHRTFSDFCDRLENFIGEWRVLVVDEEDAVVTCRDRHGSAGTLQRPDLVG